MIMYEARAFDEDTDEPVALYGLTKESAIQKAREWAQMERFGSFARYTGICVERVTIRPLNRVTLIRALRREAYAEKSERVEWRRYTETGD